MQYKPEKFSCGLLGDIVYRRDVDWYEVLIKTNWGPAEISLGCEEYNSVEELAKDLQDLCSGVDAMLDRAFEESCKKMVPLKNELWRDDDEPLVTKDTLRSVFQSEPKSIAFNKGGLAEIFFGDGGLFGGHDIAVWRDEDGTIHDPHLAG